MGAGRKKQTILLKEKPLPSSTVNCSAAARNLGKRDLGAVIFGCKHYTIEECYSEQLFGLPAPHFSYVKNIRPGLPLFLFNYTDRKLHGIFEAASQGQLNINPHGWTADGSDHTKYEAQVRVRLQMQCQPLLEEQFAPVISDNYFEGRHFWFELDQAQTRKLISLFSSSPIAARAKPFKALPISITRQIRDVEAPVSQAGPAYSNQCHMQWGTWDVGRENQLLEGSNDATEAQNCVNELVRSNSTVARSYSSVVCSTSTPVACNTTTSGSQKTWSSLFSDATNSDKLKEEEDFRIRDSDLKSHHSHQYVIEWESSCISPNMEGESQLCKAHTDLSTTGTIEEVHLGAKSHSDYLNTCVTETASSAPQSSLCEALTSTDRKQDGERFTSVTCDGDLPHSEEKSLGWGSSWATSHLEGGSQPSEACSDDHISENNWEELLHSETNCDSLYSSAKVTNVTDSVEDHEKVTVQPFPVAEIHLEDGFPSQAMAITEIEASEFHSVVSKLVQEIQGLKSCQLMQVQKLSSLEQELVESKLEIQQLKSQCHGKESTSRSLIGHVQEAVVGERNEPCPKMDDSILIVGGFDGSSWLSTLGSYSPSGDSMKPLNQMTFVRSYASAATLNGDLYIFGGVDGDLWHGTVESYNRTSGQWVSRPSLNQKKGSLAGASLYGKIYAVGGGNGVECFSEVEMLDLNIGRWINTQSLLEKRFAPAAAEINGTIYVAGGYDGRNYLNTVERFDPREHSWTRLGSMSTRRGCHSLAVLNEKLYALGGFDGTKMVSNVEIFDPRRGFWMSGEPMTESRGYFGAAVLEGRIFVIGGLKENEEVSDKIESYEEGWGWEVTNLKGVGKRCFFSAIVL